VPNGRAAERREVVDSGMAAHGANENEAAARLVAATGLMSG